MKPAVAKTIEVDLNHLAATKLKNRIKQLEGRLKEIAPKSLSDPIVSTCLYEAYPLINELSQIEIAVEELPF